MNKIKKRIVALVTAVLAVSLVFTACKKDESTGKSKEKKVVIATTFSAYDWARNIADGSDGIEVLYLVDSKVDLHSYQPSVSDMAKYKEADLVICVGGESEEWVSNLGLPDNKILSLINVVDAKEEELVEGMEEESEESEEGEKEVEYDEHIWLSLKNAGVCCDSIEKKMASLDSKNASLYEMNLKKYILKLKELDTRYEDVVSGAKYDTLIFGDRFPFRYMVEDYGLNYYAAFIGCSAETEASFETVAFLAEKVKELGVPVICTIGNRTIAETIVENSNLKSEYIVEFDSLQSVSNHEEGKTYLGAMESNLDALEKALGYKGGN